MAKKRSPRQIKAALSTPARRTRRVTSLDILRSNVDLAKAGSMSLTTTDQPVADLPMRQDRTFPRDMPRPGAEYGATGTPIFGGFVSGEDYNPNLDGALAMKVYDQMRRSDAQVQATMRVLKLPLRAADWEVDPPDGSEDPQDQAIADFCASALFDDDAMATPWNFTLSHILLKLDFGVSILEKVFTVGELDEIRFHRLAPRLPGTIFRWIIDPETGALEAVVQFAPKGGAFQYLTIKSKYAAVFCHEREGDNYFGRSVLRSAYQHWFMKSQAYRIDNVRLDRFGIGIPTAEIDQTKHRATQKELDELRKMLRGLRTHERAYMIVPAGVTIKILTPGSEAGGRGGAAGVSEAITHHNFMIAANILAGFLVIERSVTGGRSASHAQTLADIFQDSLQAIGDDTAGEIQQQLIRPLCDLNFDMTGRKYPRVRVSGIDSVNIPEIAKAITDLATAGLMHDDEDHRLESWLREKIGAPPLLMRPTDAPPNAGGVSAPSPQGTPAAPGTPGTEITRRPARAAPAVSAQSASRASTGAPAVPDSGPAPGRRPQPTLDYGGSVTARPNARGNGNPPITTEAGSAARPADRIARGQSKVGPTDIRLDPSRPTSDEINAPGNAFRPRDGLGPQGQTSAETAYGFGGPRKTPAKAKLRPPWPEGPLGPVKAPPPPGGAMGAPPLGFDTRVGNNDGFPLNPAFDPSIGRTPRRFLPGGVDQQTLRRDAVILDGRAYMRMPTDREVAFFNLREIPDRLDYEHVRTVERIRQVRKDQVAAYLGELLKNGSAFTDLRPDAASMPFGDRIYRALRSMQDRVSSYGAEQVRLELQKQGAPVTRAGRTDLTTDPARYRRVLIVRHGETDEDEPDNEKISSWSNVPLNDHGRATANTLRLMFSQLSPLRIICSSRDRAEQTAEIIAGDRTDASIMTDANWAPWHLGKMTGLAVDDTVRAAIQDLLDNPDTAPEGGESWNSTHTRMRDAYAALLKQAQPDVYTVVICHTWQFKYLLSEAKGLDTKAGEIENLQLEPGQVCSLAVDDLGQIVRLTILSPMDDPLDPVMLKADPSPKATATKTAAKSTLVSSAKITTERLDSDLKGRVIDFALRARRRGVTDDDLRDAVLDEFDDETLDRGVGREVAKEVSEAFSLGRGAEAAALGGEWDSVQYSALLDACEECLPLDGEEWAADDPAIVEPPNPDCLGGDNCRCVLLYLAGGSA